MGRCRVRADWFLTDDTKGRKVSEWAVKHNDNTIFCIVCSCTVNIALKGFQAIVQHAGTVRHQREIRTKLGETQLRLTGKSDNLHKSTLQPKCIQLYDVTTRRVSAELLWIMKCLSTNYSAASCDGIADVFEAMFPDAVSCGFGLSRTKFRYLVADALGPYFKQELIDDLQGAYYTLIYDETTNARGSKELQILVRYWSDKSSHPITSQHLETFFIGQATAKDIQAKIDTAIDTAGLSREKLLMLGCDGPNVNKKVTRLINENLLSIRTKKLVEMGTCNIHTVHNAYLKGLHKLRENASELVLAVYYFFNGWPVRWDDFSEIRRDLGLPNNHFIKHVTSRWLTLEGSVERLLQQWPALLKYFLQHIPTKRAKLSETNNYKKIVKLLQISTIQAELLFASSTARIFTKFTGTFQKEEPLVHVMFAELTDLVYTLLGRICPPEKIPEVLKDVTDCFFKKTDNLLPLKNILCGTEVSTQLTRLKERDKLTFLNDARQFFIHACTHIVEKTGIADKPLLKHLRCLHPVERTSKRSCNDIIMVAKALPFDMDFDTLLDEWKLLQLEKYTPETDKLRIDTYWNQFCVIKSLTGNLKYSNVTKVVKAALALSHGSADVERGFSTSGRVLTEERASMSARTLNAILTVKDALKRWENKPHLVPITKKLLGLARGAYKHYESYLEEERHKKEQIAVLNSNREMEASQARERARKLQEETRDIKSQEVLLKEKRLAEEAKRKVVSKLFSEANDRLKRAVENKNLEEVELAQAMMQGVQDMRQAEETRRQEANSIQKAVEKRKSSVIAKFTNK